MQKIQCFCASLVGKSWHFKFHCLKITTFYNWFEESVCLSYNTVYITIFLNNDIKNLIGNKQANIMISSNNRVNDVHCLIVDKKLPAQCLWTRGGLPCTLCHILLLRWAGCLHTILGNVPVDTELVLIVNALTEWLSRKT